MDMPVHVSSERGTERGMTGQSVSGISWTAAARQDGSCGGRQLIHAYRHSEDQPATAAATTSAIVLHCCIARGVLGSPPFAIPKMSCKYRLFSHHSIAEGQGGLLSLTCVNAACVLCGPFSAPEPIFSWTVSPCMPEGSNGSWD